MMWLKISFLFFIFLVDITLQDIPKLQKSSAENLMTPKIYSNLFERRREEHKMLYKHIMETENYEKRYKLLGIAYTNVLAAIYVNKKILDEHNLSSNGQDCPTNASHFESLTVVTENTCLFGDLILHIPTMSYKLLNKNHKKWREIIDWSLNYVKTMKCDILSEKTKIALDLFDQEINIEKRTENFVNPYVGGGTDPVTPKTKKKRDKKKLKRGPQLRTLTEFRNEL